MTRRRRRAGSWLPASQDPGKDLFAFLFIMVTIFSAMMLKTVEQQAGLAGQNSPSQTQAGATTLAAVAADHIGRLDRRGGELLLVFGDRAYAPQQHLAQLERDGHVAQVRGEDGQERQLYVAEDRRGQVLLGEYLEAFQQLSRAGIGVAFVERVR